MGTDNLFKKRREERKKRKHDFKTPRANSYLIVTEGERTEPFYFDGIRKQIKETIGGNVDVVSVPFIDVNGEGCSTGKLLEATERIVKNAKISYQHIWVVFDKDDFRDFNHAVKRGTDKGYHIAWSNPSFEYWLYLHFEYSDSALHRKSWNKKLDDIFKKYLIGEGRYRKNYEDIYDLLNRSEGARIAVNHAKRRMNGYCEGKMKPSEYNPGTNVFLLVDELLKYLE